MRTLAPRALEAQGMKIKTEKNVRLKPVSPRLSISLTGLTSANNRTFCLTVTLLSFPRFFCRVRQKSRYFFTLRGRNVVRNILCYAAVRFAAWA